MLVLEPVSEVVGLHVADAVRSQAPDGARLCKSHGTEYQQRLTSLVCPTLGCCHLVMTATTLERRRARQLRATPQRPRRRARRDLHVLSPQRMGRDLQSSTSRPTRCLH